jgi:hypothetical protein
LEKKEAEWREKKNMPLIFATFFCMQCPMAAQALRLELNLGKL